MNLFLSIHCIIWYLEPKDEDEKEKLVFHFLSFIFILSFCVL